MTILVILTPLPCRDCKETMPQETFEYEVLEGVTDDLTDARQVTLCPTCEGVVQVRVGQFPLPF